MYDEEEKSPGKRVIKSRWKWCTVGEEQITVDCSVSIINLTVVQLGLRQGSFLKLSMSLWLTTYT